MAILISPLELKLDEKNPRFVILSKRNQDEIRKYLLGNEDIAQLAVAINTYGNLLPGERIVVIQEKNKYIVIEGNRRTCSLQLLLSRKLIPHLFEHKIPSASKEIIKNCQKIEVDVLLNRDFALSLMARRHIEGVKQWKPLAKKQFFSSNYQDGKGRSIDNLSEVTGISKSVIKTDIRDYKLFYNAYENYKKSNHNFDKEIINIDIDPFLRLFKAKFIYPTSSNSISPLNFFGIEYDEHQNISNTIDNGVFEKIVRIAFEKAVVTEEVNTRNVLTDIASILPLLDKINKKRSANQQNKVDNTPGENNADDPENGQQSEGEGNGGSSTGTSKGGNAGGPKPGGPPPKSFFETISWRGKLDPKEEKHQGLLVSVNELFKLSNNQINRKKGYELFPIATGMVLRTAYEQALRLQLIKVNLWGVYHQSLHKDSFPTLSSMENFIKQDGNKAQVFSKKEMLCAFDSIIAAKHREFLNANIHFSGRINVTPDTLEGIASGGMFYLIQNIINNLLP